MADVLEAVDVAVNCSSTEVLPRSLLAAAQDIAGSSLPWRNLRIGEFPTEDRAADVAEEIAHLTGAWADTCRGRKLRVGQSELLPSDEAIDRLVAEALERESGDSR